MFWTKNIGDLHIQLAMYLMQLYVLCVHVCVLDRGSIFRFSLIHECRRFYFYYSLVDISSK